MFKRVFISQAIMMGCLIASTFAFAQQSQPSLWCGSENNYACTDEQKIAKQRRQMQRREKQSAGRYQGQPDMERYWELLQRQREWMERQSLRPN